MKSALAFGLSATLLSGCASIFTGTTQNVTVDTGQPGQMVVVLGDPSATALLELKDNEDMAKGIVDLIAPLLPPDRRAALDKLSVEELITRMVVWVKLDQVPPELAGSGMAALPDAIKEQLSDLLGIEAVGPSPLTATLDKGDEYAVIAWQKGYQAGVGKIDTTFNYVTLVDILTAGLGVIVDAWTGAWFDLTPDHVQVTLQPEAPPPAPAPPPHGTKHKHG
jgi:hypothetical protein